MDKENLLCHKLSSFVQIVSEPQLHFHQSLFWWGFFFWFHDWSSRPFTLLFVPCHANVSQATLTMERSKVKRDILNGAFSEDCFVIYFMTEQRFNIMSHIATCCAKQRTLPVEKLIKQRSLLFHTWKQRPPLCIRQRRQSPRQIDSPQMRYTEKSAFLSSCNAK